MDMTRFKMAVLSLNDFSDSEIKKLFFDLEVASEDDICEAIGIISIHRPKLLENLTYR